MSGSRSAALGALVLIALAIGLGVAFAGEQFPGGLLVAALIAVATVAVWYAVVRRGAIRAVALAVASVGAAVAVIVALADGKLHWLLVAGVLALSSVCARAAFGARLKLPAAPRPERPVLFLNPKSGGGKAERFHLADEARARGIEPVVLERGDDLFELVRDAVAGGADALAMAGGDGSQAIVASIAAEHGLPYACIPSGTRNHFALDLGVDRDDVVGALDAFVDGGERRVDLAEVNGRVFVNNVSLGVYAEAVQREGYREAKLRTLVGTLSDWQRDDGRGPAMSWHGPGGHTHREALAILVSNNRYRLGHAVGSGTRPRIDDGMLGVTVAGRPAGREGSRGLGRPQRPWREWSAPTFEVDAEAPVPAGIDGEAVVLEPPLRFGIRPGVLRVRIAARHPGASPSALMPEHAYQGIVDLARIAAGRSAQRSPRARSQV